MQKKIVISGIRPTAEDQHLGNYLGAIRYFVELARKEEYSCFFFVADLHALTTCGSSFDAAGICRGRDAIVLNLLASGIDPQMSTIYTQSAVPEITELAWILACLSRVHILQDMHHWAEKKSALINLGIEANAGLLTYPVLMAADILGLRADVVPVGKDQHQHVEFARDLARAFHRITGNALFPVPDLHEQQETTVKSLTRPKEKMGKSDPDGCLFLNDPPDVIGRKLGAAFTDPARKRRTDAGNPDGCNIYVLHQDISPSEDLVWAREGCQTASIGCRDCKSRLATHINTLLTPLRDRRQQLEAQGADLVKSVLNDGNRRARTRIAETVAAAKELMGLALAVV